MCYLFRFSLNLSSHESTRVGVLGHVVRVAVWKKRNISIYKFKLMWLNAISLSKKIPLT